VFTDNSINPTNLLMALDSDYQDAEDLRLKLLETGPKVGNDDERADALLVTLN